MSDVIDCRHCANTTAIYITCNECDEVVCTNCISSCASSDCGIMLCLDCDNERQICPKCRERSCFECMNHWCVDCDLWMCDCVYHSSVYIKCCLCRNFICCECCTGNALSCHACKRNVCKSCREEEIDYQEHLLTQLTQILPEPLFRFIIFPYLGCELTHT